MNSLYGKVVWITGASSGIGEALSHEVAKEGPSKIILSARRKNELKRVQDDLCSKYKRPKENVLIVPFDLSSEESIKKAFQTVKRQNLKIDVLINNAGISQRSLFEQTEMDVYRQIMETNFFGIILLTKLVLPMMQQSKTGAFVGTSSILGKYPSPGRTGYVASKHALNGFYDSLRIELSPDNIHVLLVCPGYVSTNVSKNSLIGDGSKYNIMSESQKNGISSKRCAEQIILALKQKKREIYPGGLKERIAIYLKFFAPAILDKILTKIIKI